MRRLFLAAIVAISAAVSAAASAQTLKVVMHSNPKVLDLTSWSK